MEFIDSGEELAGAHRKWPTGHGFVRERHCEKGDMTTNSPQAKTRAEMGSGSVWRQRLPVKVRRRKVSKRERNLDGKPCSEIHYHVELTGDLLGSSGKQQVDAASTAASSASQRSARLK